MQQSCKHLHNFTEMCAILLKSESVQNLNNCVPICTNLLKFAQLFSNLYSFAQICIALLKFVQLCWKFVQFLFNSAQFCLHLSQICTTLLKFIQFNSLQRKRSCLLCRNINDGCERFTTLNSGQQLPHRKPHLHEDLLRQQPGHQAAGIWRPVQHQDAAQARRPGQPGANVIKKIYGCNLRISVIS